MGTGQNKRPFEQLSSAGQLEGDTSSLFADVLLIEDEPSHAQLLKRAMKGLVGEINHVTSGAEALEAVQSTLPELVFCDLYLPDMTGNDVLQAIGSLRPQLPVVVMTSSSKIDDAVAAMRGGASDYMVKEFSPEFSERLKIVIDRLASTKLQQLRELQVRGERDAFWQAARAAQDGLAIVNSEGNVVFGNPAFEKFCESTTGTTGEITGTNVVELVSQHNESVGEELSAQLNRERGQGGESLWRSELRLKVAEDAKTQPYFEIALTTYGFAANNGEETPIRGLNLRRHVIWVRDITRKKEQERFQRDILSTTSHDLKGPLGAILTSSELLEGFVESDNKNVPALITRIGSCARNCITLIDELLSARRIQDGVLMVNPRWYTVSEIIEDIVLDYLPMAKAKSIALTSRPVEDGLQVYADKLGLHRVLSNLVSNALKFTPNGESVELVAKRSDDEVSISVIDTGCGIEPELRHNLFNRYSRLAKHHEVDGTGLGLFVAKSIVDAHDGRIDVRSEVGSGTTFVVSFPNPHHVAEEQ